MNCQCTAQVTCDTELAGIIGLYCGKPEQLIVAMLAIQRH